MSISCYSKNCVRVKHLPSGYEVICDNSRYMHKNKDLGVKTIRARLYADGIGLERPSICEDTEGTVCPICEKGILKQVHEYLHYEYKNGNFYENPLSNEYEVLSVYLVCQGEDACGSEQVDGYCLSYNKETIKMFYEMLYEMKEKSCCVGQENK